MTLISALYTDSGPPSLNDFAEISISTTSPCCTDSYAKKVVRKNQEIWKNIGTYSQVLGDCVARQDNRQAMLYCCEAYKMLVHFVNFTTLHC